MSTPDSDTPDIKM
jgi:hypothetical protein